METLINQFKSFLLELPSSRQGGKKGLSKVSVKNYLSDIRRFLDWLSQYQPQISSAIPQRLNSDHFQAYLDFLTHQDLPHSTISRHFSSLRRFATFIEIIYHQPPLTIPSINSPDATPKPEPTTIQTSSPNLLSSFSSYLKDQQKSASTVRNYLSDIRHFLAWVDQHPKLNTLPSAQQLDSSLESDVIDQYSHYLELTNTPSSTSSRRLSSLNIFTQFATNQGLISPKTKPETSSPRLKPIPALSWLKPKTSSRQGFNLNLPSFIQKPISRLTSSPAYRSYHQLPFTPYLHLALLVLFTSAFALFGFRQIIIQSERIAAYPSTPNRPTRQLSFQGRLTDSSGTPIVTPINATFKLWDQETGGTEGTCSGGSGEDCLYSTTTCSVDPDQDGIFNVLLGDGACGSEIPADVFTENTAVWLEVEVATETLTPRQAIATVAYALNSETVSGIPVSASGSATVNTLFFMNSSGEIVLGEQNPSIVADSGNFTLQGEALTLSTTPFSEGDITIAPDGIGQVNFIGGTTTDDFIRVVNANLTTGSLISGYVGNDNNTGELLRLSSGSSETDRFVVTTGGQTTIDALALGKSAFIVNQLNSGPIFTASASGTPKFTINNSGTITLANNTIITDDTNYTRFSRGIAVGSNETYYFNASGNINANNLTLSGTTTLNGLTYTWPSSQSTNYVLSTNGSGTLSWVDPVGAAATVIYWNQANGSLFPKNESVDLLVGGSATSSAKFAFINVNSGTPTASISGTTANVATYLTGEGNLQTTNRANLNLAGTTTGNLNVLDRTGSPFTTFDTLNERVGVGATSPTYKFEVAGSGVTGLSINPEANGPVIRTIAGGVNNRLYIQPAAGSVYFDTSGVNNTQYMYDSSSNLDVQISTGGITFFNGGNVGIGDTSPASLLTVGNGDLFQVNSSGIIASIDGVAHTIDDVSGNLTLTSNSTTVSINDNLSLAGNITSIGGVTHSISDSSGDLQLASNSTTVSVNDNLNVTGSINSTTGYYYAGTSSPLSLELTRTIPATTDDYVEIGNVSLTNGAHNLRVSITVSTSGFSVAKTYIIPMKYSQATSWQKVSPISDTGPYNTNNFDLDIQVSANTASLRIRRTAGATVGTAYVRVESTGYTADAFTATSATGSTTAPTGIFSSTPLAQVEGKVGIGTTSPAEALDITGNLKLSGTTTFNNITYTWPASQTATYVLSTDGSGGLTWTDPAGAAASAIYWDQSGGALYPKNATVDLLVGGSASSSASLRVEAATGNLISLAGAKWMPRSDSTSALNIANAAGTSFVTFDTTNQRVGIGTSSPISPLSVGPSSQFQVDSSGRIISLDGVAHTIDDVSGNLTLSSNSTTVSINDSLNVSGSIIASGYVQANNFRGGLYRTDDRSIAPIDFDSTEAHYVFTSYNNNSTSPYADGFVFRGWNDSSGGSDNLISFSRSSIAARMWQQTYGSATNFTNYEEFTFTGTGGTTNYIPKYTDANTIGNSAIIDISGNIGIGDTTPASLLTVGDGDLFQVNSSGIIASIDGVAHTIDDISGNLTLTSNSSTISLNDNVTFAGTTTLNGLTYTWPSSQTSNYVLSTNGSGTLSWVDVNSAAAGNIYWSQANGAVYPKNDTVDLLVGGSATSSAKFAFINVNSGTPTASISGTTANVATYLTGEGNLQTTNRANLNLAGTTTGNLNVLDRTGSAFTTFDTLNGRVGIGTSTPNHLLQATRTASNTIRTAHFGMTGGTTNTEYTVAQFDVSGSGAQSPTIKISSNSTAGLTLTHTDAFTRAFIDHNFSSATSLALGLRGSELVTILNDGSVGIGNTSPTSLFSVGSSSQFQVNTAGNIVAIGGASHTIYNSSGNLIINSAGALNIADTNIQLSGGSTTLDVYNNAADTTLTLNNSSATYRSHLSLEGQLKLGTYTATPSGIAAGAVYYDTTLDRPYYFNGIGNWVPFSAGEGGGGSKWTITDGLLHPNNSTLDLTIGDSSTSSAAFAFTGISSSTRTATVSGNLALSVPTGSAPTTTLNILNGGSFDIKTSVGGDAGLASRLFVSNSGNIGIGTNSPNTKLHVYDNSSSDLFFKIENANTDYQSRLSLTSTRSWDLISQGDLSGANGSFWIYDATAGQARLAIDTSGNVGIGTATPGAKLDIAGASSTITNTSGDITINSASGKISFAGDSLNNFLHATASGQIKPGSYGSDPYPIGDGAIIYRSDLGQLNYYNGSSWQPIGSGSGSYWSEFDGLVYPTAYSVYDLAIGGDTTASAKFFVNHSTGSIKIADTAGTDFHTIANDGNNLKITGSSNGSKVILQPDLQINGGDILGSTGATRISLVDSLSLTSVSGFLAVDRAATISAGLASDLTLHLKGAASQTANYMAITSNGGSTGNIFTVDSSGNVGIGDTSPSAKLDVAGSATISGTLAVGVMNQVDAGTCDAAAEGRIFYDKGVRLYKACTYNSDDSSYAWRPLSGLSDQHRRDISTDSVVNNQIVRKGWTYAQGTGAPGVTATVSYGITYEDTPIVVAVRAGTKSTAGAPSSLGDCSSSTYYIEKGQQMKNISTTGFQIEVASSSGGYPTTTYVCFTWIAIGTYSAGYGADLAEYYLTHDASLDAAEIVAIDPDNDIAVTKADPTTNPAVIGIVSTQAAAILGNKDGTTPGVTTSITGQEVENGSKTVPVALAGRVPVKVSLENGPIYRGDPLTLSPTLPGTAVKATTPGPIIGRALENFTGTTTIIDSLDQSQASNEQQLEKQAFDDLNQGVGKIMVFIQNSYYSPVMTASTATSSATIAFDHQGNLVNSNDNLLTQAQASLQTQPSFFDRFISLIVKNLTALNITSRSITTKELVSPLVEADQVTTNTLTTSLIKPQPDSDLILSLNNQSATNAGQLIITDNQDNTVTSIDSSGNATFAGELTANSAKFDSLEVGNLKANQIEGLTDTLSQIKSASEAAQLFLDRLTAKHSPQDQSLNTTAQQLVSTSSSQLLSSLENSFTIDSEGTHLALTGLSSDYAYFSDYLAVEGTLMTNDLYVENNLITSSISSPLDADDQTLYLQPTGTGAINLLSSLLVLDESGTVSLNGNLIVTGTLESGSATISGTLDLRAASLDNSEEATHSGFGRLLSIYNEQGEQVASVNASGSAEFTDLTTRQIIIAASQDSTQSANQISANSNTTIGTATIPAGEITTYIENNNISDTTLIYITPISDTKNQVLYVKNKYSCPVDAPLSCQPFFTVAINQPTTQDIQFNYWLIQVQ